ncbi:MAG TPA: DUF928 domain-containing protein [Solirubrobacterales bacterium]|nr:DUF928 domain-containing protein [Solirubrobacterales bacterium]
MRSRIRGAWVLLTGLALLASSLPGMAQERQGGTQPSAVGSGATSAAVPVYKPPLRGAPGGRVGGGTRGTAGRDTFMLSVLAPDANGLTVSEQPSLYWFISADISLPVEVTIADPNGTQPLLEKRVPIPVKRGVQRFSLADHGVKLAPGIPYRWSVTVVSDPNRRSRDILASGTIERVEPPAGLGAKLQGASKANLAFLYADAGIWYDALSAVSELIESSPNDAELLRQREALLTQAGLPEIARDR